jgi:hypothetical protein
MAKDKDEKKSSQLIDHLEQKRQVSELSELGILKIDQFLAAKEVFLRSRARIIVELQECFNEVESNFTQNEKIGKVSKAVIGMGRDVAKNAPHFFALAIPSVLGEIGETGSSLRKIGMEKKGDKNFRILLEDGKLSQLEEAHKSLIKTFRISKEEVGVFDGDYYKISDIIIDEKIGI